MHRLRETEMQRVSEGSEIKEITFGIAMRGLERTKYGEGKRKQTFISKME